MSLGARIGFTKRKRLEVRGAIADFLAISFRLEGE